MKTLTKYVLLTIAMISLLLGGATRVVTSPVDVFNYNQYFQMGAGLCLFIWLSHKFLSWKENRNSRPIVNARDLKKGK